MREDRQRIDKWLWHARFARTRSASTRLVEAGRVRVAGQRITQPARLVGVGDIVTVAAEHATVVLRILAIAEKRGSATDARTLYEDIGA